MKPITSDNNPLEPYYFHTQPENICGQVVKPITEEYVDNYPTVVDRFFTRYYYIKPGTDFAPYKILFHSNRICLICIPPEHPIFEEGVSSFNFDVGGVDRSKNNVSGKGKKGGMVLQSDSTLAIITSKTGNTYKVPSCVRSKLVEVNVELAKQPDLLLSVAEGEGYVAIVLPKIEHIDEIKATLLNQEQYDNYILERKTTLPTLDGIRKIDYT